MQEGARKSAEYLYLILFLLKDYTLIYTYTFLHSSIDCFSGLKTITYNNTAHFIPEIQLKVIQNEK